ncbi:unnamed protein product [Lactuca virosa]|uniref:PPM-type phosphatase domain-containing protein n=1 Tax=Lactuca virosa TaxID=75947 RepID=A0AAU9LWM7_9ASTR|nr:unnamed protein product [Lactuca virosa]
MVDWLSFCLHQSTAVLCRNGIAIPLSQEDMPRYLDEKKRVEELGVYTEEGHLNCELAVMRALGGWAYGVTNRCAGIWHVVSNQEAVGVANTCG